MRDSVALVKMLYLSTVFIPSCLLLRSVLCSPLGSSYTNTTIRSTRTVRLTQTITSSIAPTAVVDSSCGGCKVVANGAHLLYWYDEVLHIPVETVVYKGVNATSSFPSVSHSVGITKPLPAAGATKTLLYEENVNDIETGPKHIATNIVSGFAA